MEKSEDQVEKKKNSPRNIFFWIKLIVFIILLGIVLVVGFVFFYYVFFYLGVAPIGHTSGYKVAQPPENISVQSSCVKSSSSDVDVEDLSEHSAF